jgi:hypothetical protein
VRSAESWARSCTRCEANKSGGTLAIIDT